jgi:hypothetical protein
MFRTAREYQRLACLAILLLLLRPVVQAYGLRDTANALARSAATTLCDSSGHAPGGSPEEQPAHSHCEDAPCCVHARATLVPGTALPLARLVLTATALPATPPDSGAPRTQLRLPPALGPPAL